MAPTLMHRTPAPTEDPSRRLQVGREQVVHGLDALAGAVIAEWDGRHDLSRALALAAEALIAPAFQPKRPGRYVRKKTIAGTVRKAVAGLPDDASRDARIEHVRRALIAAGFHIGDNDRERISYAMRYARPARAAGPRSSG